MPGCDSTGHTSEGCEPGSSLVGTPGQVGKVEKAFLDTDGELLGQTLCYSSPSPMAKGGFGLGREVMEGHIQHGGRTPVQEGGSRQLGVGG